MDSRDNEGYSGCHVVALPFPGRGHINPMMSVCMLLASKGLVVTVVVTEEWLSLLGSGPDEPNIHMRSIPNVIPSELNRGAGYKNFIEAVFSKMEDPFDHLLDHLETPVSCILADTYLPWAVCVGNRRNIPVASLYPQASMMFALFYHSDLLAIHGHYPVDNAKERGDELIDYIPGVPSLRISELPSILTNDRLNMLKKTDEVFSSVRNTQYILFTSPYELQPDLIDTLRSKVSIPMYTIGPSIPYMSLGDTAPSKINDWLDLQPEKSVLYVSLGSYKPILGAQMHEIVMALRSSGARFVWIARGEAFHLQEACGNMGLVIPWCEQLKVLCHSSIRAFLTHCGWNSTLEGIYAGVPMLTFPLIIDQITNSKFIVDDWKIGLKVKTVMDNENVVGREAIARVIQRVMEDGVESKELRRRAKELQLISLEAMKKGGSSDSDLHAFITDISRDCSVLANPRCKS